MIRPGATAWALVPVPSTRISLICGLPPTRSSGCHTRCALIHATLLRVPVPPLEAKSRRAAPSLVAAPLLCSCPLLAFLYNPCLETQAWVLLCSWAILFSSNIEQQSCFCHLHNFLTKRAVRPLLFVLFCCLCSIPSFFVVVFLNRKETTVDC